MEQAILKTLIYADIFDYPLKAYEIHKWLIRKKASFQQVQKKLANFKEYKGFYYLKKKNKVLQRIKNERISKRMFLKAKIVSQVLKLIPWIKLVGISGGLALENACKKDDIDLFIITAKSRIWLARLFSILLLAPFRRTKKSKNVAGKFCLNIFIDENSLAQRRDLYTAHEILQMKVVWERDGMYGRFLEENEWAFKYLPNWTTRQIQSSKFKIKNYKLKIFDLLENIARWVQLKYMGKSSGLERINEGALYFHPRDCRQSVLDKVC